MSLRHFLDKRRKKRSGKVDTSTPEEPAHPESHRSSSPSSELTGPESSRPENDDIWVQADKSLRENTKTAEVLENAARILQESGLIFAEESAQKHLQLCNFLNEKSRTLEDRKWVVGEWKPASRIKLTKIFQNILMVKDIITSAASASPPAAIACAGLIVALTLFIRAKEEKGSLLQGLEKTAALIPRLYEMQKLYLSSDLDAKLTEGYMLEFKKSLTDLCSNVLEFHARALCYLDKGSVSQTLRSMFKQDAWGDLIKHMESSEIEAGRFIGLIDAAEMNIKWQKWTTRDEELQKKTEAQQVWQITQDRDEKIARLLRVLYTCPYQDRKDRNSERVPGTCEWFTGHKLFRNWNLSCDSCLLWASADPGCGKSVLAKYLIDSVLPRNDRVICYFFFKDDLTDQRTATGALSSLLRQLIIARPSLLTDSVLETANSGGENLLHSFQDLWSMLMSLAENSKTEEIVFVVDALDECCDQERNTFLSAVTSLYLEPKSTHAVKFLLTSRPYGHIRSAFRELQEHLPTIHLSGESGDEAEQISREINLVTEHLIKVLVKEKDLLPDEHQLLKEELKPVRNRTYLWVTLTLGFIKEDTGFTKGKVRQTLRHRLPHTVNEAYEKILNQSPDQGRARLFLQIILAARRPLSLEELSVAEALKRARQSNQEVLDDIEPVERFKNTVRDICGLLLWISDGNVYLLHQTVKEFLVPSESGSGRSESGMANTWQSSLKERDSDRILAERCVWLLASDLEGPS
ncbi:hypothetical protein N7456_013614 [Penicillium angulare]|uniref:NWD NACHT-NTPase N-terminal domain-containing protein n=1 Tax=Penicillium angulare TaxID=116970 RepID=A0A9W9EFM7_9EURO|nr:hypothetical protein N7456_013614 [Penicillium angulare]